MFENMTKLERAIELSRFAKEQKLEKERKKARKADRKVSPYKLQEIFDGCVSDSPS